MIRHRFERNPSDAPVTASSREINVWIYGSEDEISEPPVRTMMIIGTARNEY